MRQNILSRMIDVNISKLLVFGSLFYNTYAYSQKTYGDSIHPINHESQYCFDLDFDYRSCDSLRHDLVYDSFLSLIDTANLELSNLGVVHLNMSCYDRKESSFSLAQCRLEFLLDYLIPESLRPYVILDAHNVSDIKQLESPARLCVKIIKK